MRTGWLLIDPHITHWRSALPFTSRTLAYLPFSTFVGSFCHPCHAYRSVGKDGRFARPSWCHREEATNRPLGNHQAASRGAALRSCCCSFSKHHRRFPDRVLPVFAVVRIVGCQRVPDFVPDESACELVIVETSARKEDALARHCSRSRGARSTGDGFNDLHAPNVESEVFKERARLGNGDVGGHSSCPSPGMR